MDFITEDNRIYLNDESGKKVAEVTFPEIANNIVNINHTFVDSSLRGQGVASRLLKCTADKIRRDGKKAYPSCSYAVEWFKKHSEYSDIYTDNME